jgi:hypothetical protein
MLVWAVEEGSEAAIERVRTSDGGWAFVEDGLWKLRRDLKKEGRMCEWFDEGPCSSNEIVVDSMNVHHSFGCSGDLIMSDWFVRNLNTGQCFASRRNHESYTCGPNALGEARGPGG